MLGIRLNYDGNGTRVRTDSSPSLDRIIPSNGYVVGNVQIISWKANRIKNNATPEAVGRAQENSVCHCGGVALKIVPKVGGGGFDGYCKDHSDEADAAGRDRYKGVEARQAANIRNKKMWGRNGNYPNMADHNHKDNRNKHVENTRRK